MAAVSFDKERVLASDAVARLGGADGERIYYTPQFQEEFRRRRAAGEKIVDIFRSHGIGPEVIGRKRIERAASRWKTDREQEWMRVEDARRRAVRTLMDTAILPGGWLADLRALRPRPVDGHALILLDGEQSGVIDVERLVNRVIEALRARPADATPVESRDCPACGGPMVRDDWDHPTGGWACPQCDMFVHDPGWQVDTSLRFDHRIDDETLEDIVERLAPWAGALAVDPDRRGLSITVSVTGDDEQDAKADALAILRDETDLGTFAVTGQTAEREEGAPDAVDK